MRRNSIIVLAALLAWPALASAFDHAHARWGQLLSEHVDDGRIAYSKIAADPTELVSYLAALEAVAATEFESFTPAQRKAFWINAYNAYTVKLIVDHHPVETINTIGGQLRSPFKIEFIPLTKIRGATISLDTIEHQILRREFEDARIHAAIVCASLSCPALRSEAFLPDRLDEQLDGAMREFIGDPARNAWTPETARLDLSSIFKWFRADFERDSGSLEAFIAAHAPKSVARQMNARGEVSIRFRPYDWTLNGR